jgi:hypothetical protein
MNTESPRYVKLPLRIEEEGGLYFATCEELKEIFIAVRSRDDIRMAVDTCIRGVYSQKGESVRVFMNCNLVGPQVDAIVEIA